METAVQPIMTIWKETRPIADLIELELPEGSTVLKVADQEGAGGALTFWFKVPDINGNRLTPMGHPPSLPVMERPKETRRFRLLGTGHTANEDDFADFEFMDTVVTAGGMLVWHVFAEKLPERARGRE